MFKELRCDPIGFGPASVTEPVRDEETDGVCDRFLRSIGYAGICEIEMKRDTRDGQVKLIEANPRLSGGGDAAPYAGVDTCWLHYLDLIGVPVTPVVPPTAISGTSSCGRMAWPSPPTGEPACCRLGGCCGPIGRRSLSSIWTLVTGGTPCRR